MLNIINNLKLNKMNYGEEFKNYATKHVGLNTIATESFMNIQASQTPYILEERQMNVTQMDVFSRLMRERILWVASPVDTQMASIVQAQLMFLDSLDKKDINMYLDTPGGSVLSGLAIRDVMNNIKSDVATTNVGMCASMGSILLSSGAKGKRASLITAKVMTHMVSHGSQGNIQGTRINQIEAEKYNYMLFKILAHNCGKSFDEIFEISRQDRWFFSNEAMSFGLIDEIVGVEQGLQTMDSYLEGFDEYYKKEVLKIV